MNKLVWKEAATTAVKQYKSLSKACDAAKDAGCLNSEGMLFTAVWESFDSMLELVDPHGWIAWFIYGNNCGKDGKAVCSITLPSRSIKTINKLATFLVEIGEIEPQ